MPRHKYCCQNAAQNYLDHTVPVPDDFRVNPECLCGLSKEEFIRGLMTLTSTIRALYTDMVQNPSDYGLPLVEDVEYKPFNPKAAESKNSSRRLVSLLYILVHNGVLSMDKLEVSKKNFLEACKKLKVANTNMLLERLCSAGFAMSGFSSRGLEKGRDVFSLSHVDRSIVPVLYGYMKDKPLKNPLFSMNYHLALSTDDLFRNCHELIFTEYLSGDERVFFERLDQRLRDENLIVGNAPDYRDFSIEYLIDSKSEKRIVRCYSEFGKLSVRLQLHKSSSYVDFAEALPEQIKQVFRKESTCHFCREPCRMRLYRVFEGVSYTDCGYGNYFEVCNYDPNDVDYYMQIILREIGKVS